MQRGQARGRLHHRTKRAIREGLFAAAAAGRYPERDQLFLALVLDEGLPVKFVGGLMGVHVRPVRMRTSVEKVRRNLKRHWPIPIAEEDEQRYAEFVHLYFAVHERANPTHYQVLDAHPVSVWAAAGLVKERVPIDLRLSTIAHLQEWLRVRAQHHGYRNPLNVPIIDLDTDLEVYLRAGIKPLFQTERGKLFSAATGYALLRALTRRAGLEGKMPPLHLLQDRPQVKPQFLREPKTMDWARAAASHGAQEPEE